MLVSYYYNQNNPKQLPHNKEEYGEPSPLKTIDLKEMLANCFNIPENVGKQESGQIYAFVADKFYRSETLKEELITTDGACLCDGDELNEEQRKTILNSFDELVKILPNLTAIWKSYSGNLHIAFRTENLNAIEYTKQELLSLVYFAWAVKKVTGILLTDKSYNGKPNLDTHNSSFSQRFFLNRLTKDDVRYNDNATIQNFDEFNLKEKEELSKFWPFLINSIYTVDKNSDKTYINEYVNYIIAGTSTGEIEYIEHRKRWNIYTCLANMIKDKETVNKIWTEFAKRIKPDKHSTQFFIEEPWKSNNWFVDRHPYPNYELLSKYGFNLEMIDKDNHCIKKGEWLTKYKKEIFEFISDNRRAEVVAPTGVGKTSFINGVNTDNDIILNDDFSLAKELNAIVLVPFVVTNKLYDSLIEVNTENKIKEIKNDRSYVMVWDQALLHWEQIKNRTLIIDEAHTLFLDRTYRDTAVKLMKKIKEDDCKIVLFTATPSGETEELDCKLLKFTNERSLINLNFLKVNSVDRAILGCIKHCLDNNKFDRIVLFDDLYAKKIYENLMISGDYINDISYIRADTKDSDDFRYLREQELLNKRLTICTCVAFNGLNFKNENESVLVITSYREGDTTAAKIIQESGRIRKSKVNVIVYYDGDVYESTLQDRIEKASTFQSAVVSLGMPDSLLSYDRRLTDSDTVDALLKIEDKLKYESDKNVIIEKLIDTGYFSVNDKDLSSDDFEKGNKLNLAVKARCSKEFIEDFLSDNEIEYKEDSYKDRWKKKINRIINNSSYEGIDKDTFKNIIQSKNKNMQIETVIGKVERIIKVCILNDIGWNNYINNIYNLKNALKNEIDKRDLMKNYNKNVNIRNKYSSIITVKENEPINLDIVFSDLFEELEQSYNTEIENRRKGQEKKIQDIDTGIVYNSKNECANSLNVSNSFISKHKSRFIQI